MMVGSLGVIEHVKNFALYKIIALKPEYFQTGRNGISSHHSINKNPPRGAANMPFLHAKICFSFQLGLRV